VASDVIACTGALLPAAEAAWRWNAAFAVPASRALSDRAGGRGTPFSLSGVIMSVAVFPNPAMLAAIALTVR
jgi:hypothetical protein